MSIISQSSCNDKSNESSMTFSEEIPSIQKINFPSEIQNQLNNFFSILFNN